ncbi:MAG TPA: oligosaccharide flippase family protein [Phycisphaerales bacterium]|nr:oligosaccharide flippase family protein [Phycisphaerales bacterium]
MSTRRRQLLSGGAVLIAGELVVQLCGLLRNFIVARLIGPEPFGIAAALAMSVSLVEMISDLGAGRFLTRAHGEDGESWLSVAHGISVARGLLGGLALFIVAGPVAHFMRMPDATWAFRVVAIVPVVRGFTHNQIWLAQRELRFKAFVACQALPQILLLLAAYPLAVWIPDFRALLWLLMANAVISTALSHVVSRKPYRLAYDRDRFRRLLGFGLPLLGDGLLMFVVLHGERIVVANVYGTSMPWLLGAYSAALLLAWTPAAIMGRVGLSLGVPHLASLRADPAARDRQYSAGARAMGVPALGLAVLFGFAGRDLVSAVFGEGYQLSHALAAWLGFGQALRIIRTFPVVIAIAEGVTLSAMLANLARAASVGVAWLAARAGQEPWTVLAIGAAGEAVGIALCAGMNRWRLGVPAGAILPALTVTSAGFAGAWWAGTLPQAAGLGVFARAAVGVGLGAIAAAIAGLADPATRVMIAGFLKRRASATPMSRPTEVPTPHEAR